MLSLLCVVALGTTLAAMMQTPVEESRKQEEVAPVQIEDAEVKELDLRLIDFKKEAKPKIVSPRSIPIERPQKIQQHNPERLVTTEAERQERKRKLQQLEY